MRLSCALGWPAFESPYTGVPHSGFFIPWGHTFQAHPVVTPGLADWAVLQHEVGPRDTKDLWLRRHAPADGQGGPPPQVLFALDHPQENPPGCIMGYARDNKLPLGSIQATAYRWDDDSNPPPWLQVPTATATLAPRWRCPEADCPYQCCVHCAKLYQRQEYRALDDLPQDRQDRCLPHCPLCDAQPQLCYTSGADGLEASAWICAEAASSVAARGLNSRRWRLPYCPAEYGATGIPRLALIEQEVNGPLTLDDVCPPHATPPPVAPRAHAWHDGQYSSGAGWTGHAPPGGSGPAHHTPPGGSGDRSGRGGGRGPRIHRDMPEPYDARYPLWASGKIAIFKPHPALDAAPQGMLSRAIRKSFHFVISGIYNCTKVRQVIVTVARHCLGFHDRPHDVAPTWNGQPIDPEREIRTYFGEDNPDLGHFKPYGYIPVWSRQTRYQCVDPPHFGQLVNYGDHPHAVAHAWAWNPGEPRTIRPPTWATVAAGAEGAAAPAWSAGPRHATPAPAAASSASGHHAAWQRWEKADSSPTLRPTAHTTGRPAASPAAAARHSARTQTAPSRCPLAPDSPAFGPRRTGTTRTRPRENRRGAPRWAPVGRAAALTGRPPRRPPPPRTRRPPRPVLLPLRRPRRGTATLRPPRDAALPRRGRRSNS